MIHSFLLIGQSNMAGRGFLSEAPELDNRGLYVMRNGRWQPLFRPVNPDRPFSGVCLAESFARRYADTYGVDVGLIPCADGGSAMIQWEKGTLLYDNAVNCAKLASRTSVVAGVLWHQGEADCNGSEPEHYRRRLETMFAHLRADAGLEGIPVVVGGLGDYLSQFHGDDIRRNHPRITAILRAYAEETPFTAFADGAGLPSNPDFLHFSAKALEEFGRRYFDAYQTVVDPARLIPKNDLMVDTHSALEAL